MFGLCSDKIEKFVSDTLDNIRKRQDTFHILRYNKKMNLCTPASEQTHLDENKFSFSIISLDALLFGSGKLCRNAYIIDKLSNISFLKIISFKHARNDPFIYVFNYAIDYYFNIIYLNFQTFERLIHNR